MKSLDARVVLVTGGFGALGRALGSTLAARGAQVVLLDRAPASGIAATAALQMGGVDLGDKAAVTAVLETITERLGGIDALVNVAGGFSWETLEDGSIETWDRLYTMNLRTAVLASQAVLPHLLRRGGGRIVNIGALGAVQAAAGMGAYAASKAGISRLTEALAEELKDKGITVNAVLPSIIDTPANRVDMPSAEFDRWVAPDALSAVIAFLLSDDAAAVTGALLPVRGRT